MIATDKIVNNLFIRICPVVPMRGIYNKESVGLLSFLILQSGSGLPKNE